MRLLLDTHAFLWFIADDSHLSQTAERLIAEPTNEILVSPASYWEIAIKISVGKYPLHTSFESFTTEGIEGNDFKILPIGPKHTALLTKLPFHHRDPYDRMLVAQATVEQIPLVSNDASLDAYPITRLW